MAPKRGNRGKGQKGGKGKGKDNDNDNDIVDEVAVIIAREEWA